MTKILSRDDFLSDRKFARELVEVPELGGSVYLRELSTRQLLEYNARVNAQKEQGPEIATETALELLCLLISCSACDEEGNLLFTEEDVAKLSDNKLGALTRLGQQVLKVSGVGTEVQENLKNALTSSATDSPTN